MASDLIRREALVEKSEILYQHTASGKIIPWSAVRVCAINNTPVVDAVEVVRCKDCKWRGNVDKCPMTYYEYIWDDRSGGLDEDKANKTEDDGFCHKGVKKDSKLQDCIMDGEKKDG